MIRLAWTLCCLFVLVSAFADTKTIELERSRSGEFVELEEDFVQYYTSYESRTVNEYGCLPEQVIRPICRTLPPRNQCGPRSWCHPSPYGPICQTRVICAPVPGGQYCENTPVVENICRNRLVNRTIPIERSRVLYTTLAQVEVNLGDDFPEGNFEMSIDLTQDNLTYTGTDYGSEYVLMLTKEGSRRQGQGEIIENVRIEAVHAIDYLTPVTQIPLLVASYGNRLEFQKINNPFNAPVSFELTLINRYGHIAHQIVPRSFINENENHFSIDFSFMVGRYFYPVKGSLTVKLNNDERVLNRNQFFSRQITGDFFL